MPEDVDGQVQTSRSSFTGTASDGAVSLRLDHGLGMSTTLTGGLKGETLTLEHPGKDGGVTTIKLRPGDSAAFHTELAALHDRVARAKQQADEQSAHAEAASDAAAAVENVRRLLDALAIAAENATASNPGLYETALDTIRSGVDIAKSTYEIFKSDQGSGYTENFCDDAGVLADDVSNIRGDIQAMRDDVKDNTDPNMLAADIRNLRDQFAVLGSVDPSLIPADAPTQRDVDAAIRAARGEVKNAGGADFAAAGRLLDKTQALQATVQAACDRTRG